MARKHVCCLKPLYLRAPMHVPVFDEHHLLSNGNSESGLSRKTIYTGCKLARWSFPHITKDASGRFFPLVLLLVLGQLGNRCASFAMKCTNTVSKGRSYKGRMPAVNHRAHLPTSQSI